MREVNRATFCEKQVFCLYFSKTLQVYHTAKVLLLYENSILLQYLVHARDEK